MIKDKIYITDRQTFIEWKRKYTTYDGKFYAKCCGEEEPKSYPLYSVWIWKSIYVNGMIFERLL